MKRQDFYMVCDELLISPLIALENENIIQALKNRNDEKVKELLKEEF